MPPTMSGSVAEHLTPGLREIIGTNLVERMTYYSKFYNVETSERKAEEYLYASGLPMAASKPEGLPITSYDALEGDTKTFTHGTYGLGFEVTAEAWEDDLYAGNGSALRDAATGLSDGLAERVEVDAHKPFGAEGFDGASWLVLPTVTEGLFATSHVPVSGGEAAAQANRPSTDVDLNMTSYRNALIQFEKWVNDRGLRIPAYSKPARIIVGPDQRYSAEEVVGSSNRPDTANRVENVSQNATTVEVTPYMTDADDWIIQGTKHKMVFLWRRRPKLDSFDDRRSTIAVFVGTMRYVVAPVNWLGMYGSAPS